MMDRDPIPPDTSMLEPLEQLPRVIRPRPVDPAILHLLETMGIQENQDYLGSAIDAVVKLGLDKAGRGEVKMLARVLREMRYAFKLFSRYSDTHKVSLFGSARTAEDHPAYRAAADFAGQMAGHGWMVITGAGDGIMKAGHDGAGADHSFGLAIRLPMEQEPNEVIQGDPKLIVFRHFFTRKLFFVKEADAVCLCPGGFGTHDECFETLTLIQTGKAPPMPVVMLDQPGGEYWHGWLEFVNEQLLKNHYIDAIDRSLFKMTDNVAEAVQDIRHFYSRYNSSRYVREDWVARLNTPLKVSDISRLNGQFSDILHGPIRLSAALPEESEEPRLAHLPRLIVPFNRTNFSRLRQLVDEINRQD